MFAAARAGPLGTFESSPVRSAGKLSKKRSVPLALGTIERSVLGLARAAQRLPPFVDRPVRVRDELLFKNVNPALRTGLLSRGPSGTNVPTVES
jgi:hypothetical protein